MGSGRAPGGSAVSAVGRQVKPDGGPRQSRELHSVALWTGKVAAVKRQRDREQEVACRDRRKGRP